MTVRLYLVRHGETEMNKANRLQGFNDAPLNAKGRQQAAQTAELLRSVPFTAAYSSDRRRAQATAAAILKMHPAVSLEVRTGLREYYFGQLEGQPNRRLIQTSLARYGLKTMTKAWLGGDQFAQLVRNFARMDDTGQAETLPELRRRVQSTMTRIVAAQPEEADVLVVSHGLFLGAVIDWLAPEALPKTLLKNASVTKVAVADGRWQVQGVNLNSAAEIGRVTD